MVLIFSTAPGSLQLSGEATPLFYTFANKQYHRMKIRNIHIEDYKVFKDFEIDFTHEDKPLNVVVLAGINGSGKSTLLDFIYKLICGNVSLTSGPRSDNNRIFAEEKDTKTGKSNKHTFIESLISIYQSAIEIDDPSMVNNCLVKYFPASFNYQKGFRNSILDYIDKLIYEKDKKSSEVYEVVRKKLNDIFEGFDLQVEFNMLDKDRNIFFRNKKSERIPLDQLSGGEKELITKAFTLYVSDIKDKIILIDEPESSLHPNWQNRILKIYEDFAKENNNQVIVATHSPHVIASAPEGSLRLLKKEGDRIKVVSELDGAYGYEVQRVLLEVMDVDSLRNPEINKKLEGLKSMVFNNKYGSEKYEELKRELEDTLGRNDIDLSLLRLEVAKREKMNEKNQ